MYNIDLGEINPIFKVNVLFHWSFGLRCISFHVAGVGLLLRS